MLEHLSTDNRAETVRKERRLGLLAGCLSIPEDFDAPPPSNILDTFEERDAEKLQGLKVLLAEAPLEGVDLTRNRDWAGER